MKKITMYEDENGNRFDSERECLYYEKESEFEKWYNSDNELIAYDDHDDVDFEINFGLIKNWLTEHSDQLSILLEYILK